MTNRKSAFAVTAADQTRYINVITQLNSGPSPTPFAQLVAIHADMSHHMHRMSGSDAVGEQRFLPWHRDYLLKLEKAMQQIDPGSFIPYWEWSTDRGIPPWMTGFTPTVAIPAVPMSPAHTVTVKRHPHLPAGLPTVQQITSLDQNTNLDFEQFAALLESYHDTVHVWVGGTMKKIPTAPADPLFWMHHAEVDRIWARWQSIPANAGKAPALTGANLVLDPWQPDAVSTVASISALGYQYV